MYYMLVIFYTCFKYTYSGTMVTQQDIDFSSQTDQSWNVSKCSCVVNESLTKAILIQNEKTCFVELYIKFCHS